MGDAADLRGGLDSSPSSAWSRTSAGEGLRRRGDRHHHGQADQRRRGREPEGSAALRNLVYPRHEEGFDPWNHAFIYQDGRMYPGKVVKAPWLMRAVAEGEDVGFEIETELGVTRIEGRTAHNTFHLSFADLFGMNLHQGGALCLGRPDELWDDRALRA